MIAVSLSEIAAAIGASMTGVADGSLVVQGVTTDSRLIRDGMLFVALSGANVDGAHFVDAALAAGAVAAITSEGGLGARLVVEDPMLALRSLGGLIRSKSAARVVAITGSSGKTLTKDLTAGAVATQLKTIASKASFNNEVGVPLTLCSLEADTKVLIAEVGARGPGHIAMLTPALAPDISVVLNIGQAHVGEFGGIEVTASSKRELVEGLGSDGIAILNSDDPRTMEMVSSAPSAVTFGRAEGSTLRLIDVDLDDRACATMTVDSPRGTVRLSLQLPGEHLVSNALAALAVAYALDLDLAAAAIGISSAPTSPGRTTLLERGDRLILDDAYNANPDSMRAALKTLAHLGSKRPSWAVLGEMAELGASSLEAHDGIGRLAVRLGIDHLIVVGDGAAAMARAAIQEGMLPKDVHRVADHVEAVRVLEEQAEPDAVILVKASRIAGLDVVVADVFNGHEARA